MSGARPSPPPAPARRFLHPSANYLPFHFLFTPLCSGCCLFSLLKALKVLSFVLLPQELANKLA